MSVCGREAPSIVVAGRLPESAGRAVDALRPSFGISVVGDVGSALELVSREDSDLLLVATAEPSGAEAIHLLEGVRADPEISGLPVVVLLATAAERAAAEALREGAADCVRLPVVPEELRARVEVRLQEARARERLAQDLREERELVSELRHRMKGDLQAVTSLLSLELRADGREDCRSLLRHVRGRVHTMTLLYRMQRDIDGPDGVDLPRYLKAVVDAAAENSRPDGAGLRWETVVQPVRTGLDRAGSYGLLLHELVIRAAERAGDGPCRAELRSYDDGGLVLEVEAPAGRPAGDAQGECADGVSGRLDLVHALARRLGASVETGEGPDYAIRVVVPPASATRAGTSPAAPTSISRSCDS